MSNAIETLNRRRNVLIAAGEDKRNTFSWREFCAEARELRFQMALRGDARYTEIVW